MIYISSSCVKFNKISESIRYLAGHGFRNIELSGGTDHYDQLEDDLVRLRSEFDLNYLIHNYFPPPEKHFVLNLSSTDENVYANSVKHYERALALAKNLGISKTGMHAGFLIDPQVSELGKEIAETEVIDRQTGTENFCKGYEHLKQLAGDVKIYIENNVISDKNYKTYGSNPFLLTHFDEYQQLRQRIDFPMLLDVGHLKVSCRSLGLDFKEELTKFLVESDYIHLSENDGFADNNNALEENTALMMVLESGIQDKTITLEIYDDIEKIKASQDLLI